MRVGGHGLGGRLRGHDELRGERGAVLGGQNADLAGVDLGRGPHLHGERHGVDPVLPRTEDRDLGALEPASVEEALRVLELVALHLIAEEPSFGERSSIDGLDGRDVDGADLEDRGLSDAPDDRHPEVQAGDEGRGLDPHLTVPGDDLAGRHLPAEHLPGEDPHLALTDQEKTREEEHHEDDRDDQEHRNRDGISEIDQKDHPARRGRPPGLKWPSQGSPEGRGSEGLGRVGRPVGADLDGDLVD